MRYTPLLCLLLSSCSSIWVDASAPPPEFQPVRPPGQDAVQKGVDTFVKEAHLTRPIEISALRKTDHGAGRYYVCLREVNPSADKSRLIFSVFFDDDVYKGSRLSVILEDCEHQPYHQLDIVAAEAKQPSTGLTAR
jgi:hypothetical protein